MIQGRPRRSPNAKTASVNPKPPQPAATPASGRCPVRGKNKAATRAPNDSPPTMTGQESRRTPGPFRSPASKPSRSRARKYRGRSDRSAPTDAATPTRVASRMTSAAYAVNESIDPRDSEEIRYTSEATPAITKARTSSQVMSWWMNVWERGPRSRTQSAMRPRRMSTGVRLTSSPKGPRLLDRRMGNASETLKSQGAASADPTKLVLHKANVGGPDQSLRLSLLTRFT